MQLREVESDIIGAREKFDTDSLGFCDDVFERFVHAVVVFHGRHQRFEHLKQFGDVILPADRAKFGEIWLLSCDGHLVGDFCKKAMSDTIGVLCRSSMC